MNCSHGTPPTSNRLPVLLISWMGPEVSVDNAVRFVTYHHLLLGASLIVILDNTGCAEYPARDAALSKFDFVLHERRFRCAPNPSFAKMVHGYNYALQLVSHRLVDRALIIPLDSDELVVLPGMLTLVQLRDLMLTESACTTFLGWRQFGSSGHQHAPSAGLLASYTHRAPTEAEAPEAVRLAAVEEALKYGLNPPYAHEKFAAHQVFPGKPAWLYKEQARACGLHACTTKCSSATFTSCPSSIISAKGREATQEEGLPFGARPSHKAWRPRGACERLREAAYINHYAYQSHDLSL